MERLLHWLQGFMLVKLTGYSPERFLNLCKANDIPVWDLAYQDGGYGFYMTLDGFRRIRPLVRKSQVRLRIQKRVGLPFFLRRNGKRVGFAAGFGLFFLLLYLLSLFIWDIQVEGNRRYTDETIDDLLRGKGIVCGMLKGGIDCDQLEADLRDELPEITWAAARISGTRLLIAVKENEVLSHIPERDEAPCDLVAEKPGIVCRVVVRQGKAQVKVGDIVDTGQVLVSGTIPILDDSGEVKAVRYVHADADVLAYTEYPVSQSIPKLHRVEVETGRRKEGLFLKAGPLVAVFLLPAKEGEEWIYMMEERQARLSGSFFLPFYWGRIRGREVDYHEAFYTKEELEQVSEGIYQELVKNSSEKGVQIIENNVKILEDGSACRLTGTILTMEPVTQVRPITEQKETEDIGYEHNGEYDRHPR